MSEINLLLSLKSKLCMQKTVQMDVKRVLIDEQKRSLMHAGTNSSNLSHVKGVHKKTAMFAKLEVILRILLILFQ